MFYDVTRFSRKIIEGERLVEAAERGMRVWSLTGEYDLATRMAGGISEDMVSAASESTRCPSGSGTGRCGGPAVGGWRAATRVRDARAGTQAGRLQRDTRAR